MKTKIALATAVGMLLLAGAVWADVPAPPVNQDLGMDDIAFTALTEADCRVCHPTPPNPDRHHNLYDSVVPSPSVVPYPQFNTPDPLHPAGRYNCMSCHSDTFILERDCTQCHNAASPHHTTQAAVDGDCQACHGSLVDNMGDGHYIPIYAPSLVTPTRSQGDGLPNNSYGNGAGACNYCHDAGLDTGSGLLVLNNEDNHHGTGLDNCSWCHNFGLPFDEQIRVCEGCHGPDSLHNIQVDSPNLANVGTIVVGGEDPGYGHVGRDAGPGDSDCWGCHGFGFAAEPYIGPVIPSITGSDVAIVNAGEATSVVLQGAAFTNDAGDLTFTSDVTLTAADGSSVTLTPYSLEANVLGVTIPGDTAPGNYDVQAVKAEFASNPTVISVRPEVAITGATADGGAVTITGSGFSGYADGSGTSVTGKVTTGRKKNRTTVTEEGTIVSWSDTSIEVSFTAEPSEVTVNALFGAATAEVGGGGGGGGKPPKPPKPPK